MTFEDYVKNNQKIIQRIKDRTPGEEIIDMYYGTLDYAVSRFNSILLKLSQDKIKEQDYILEVKECYKAIQDFDKNVERFEDWPRFVRPVFKVILHGIGSRRIPKIKNLYNKVISNDESGRT